jgi:hypothetical protein
LQEEHLQLPGAQEHEVHLQEAESQAMMLFGCGLGLGLGFSVECSCGMDADGLCGSSRERKVLYLTPRYKILRPGLRSGPPGMSPTRTRAV